MVDPVQPSMCGVPMKWIALTLNVAQTAGLVFLLRLSRTVEQEGPRYLNTTAVFLAECLKLVCSFLFFWYEKGHLGSALKSVQQHLTRDVKEVLKISIPSFLYTVQTNLLFVSLSNLSGAVFQVTYQLKILSTSVLSVIMLGTVLGPTKWAALLMLTCGVSLIQFPRGADANTQSEGNAFVGFIAVLSACMTSGFAGVYLEKLLKQGDASIWLRNIQLAVFGVVLAFFGALVKDGAKIVQDGFLQGYSPLVWAVILMQAVGGLAVAAVLKYADNILKCFGTAASTMITCVFSAVVLQEFVPDVLFVVGTLLVLTATTLYSLGVPKVMARKPRADIALVNLVAAATTVLAADGDTQKDGAV